MARDAGAHTAKCSPSLCVSVPSMSNKTALSVPARSSTARGKAQMHQLRAQVSRAAAISAADAMPHVPGGGGRGRASRCGSAGADIAARGCEAALRRLMARSGARSKVLRLLLMMRLIHDVRKAAGARAFGPCAVLMRKSRGLDPLQPCNGSALRTRAPEPAAAACAARQLLSRLDRRAVGHPRAESAPGAGGQPLPLLVSAQCLSCRLAWRSRTGLRCALAT